MSKKPEVSFISGNLLDERAITTYLKSSGKISDNDIKTILNNLKQLFNSRLLPKEKLSIVVHNIVNNDKYRAMFIKDPKKTISEANPQPSP